MSSLVEAWVRGGAGRLHRKEREARAAEQLQLRRGRRRQRPEACPPATIKRETRIDKDDAARTE